ncbi:TPA: hypothetical protein ACIJXV_001121 [Klebsiella pneumoniae]
MTTDITELAQSHELLIANGQQTADLLRHLADNEIDSDYFAVVSECESYGKETDAELSITEFALRAAGYVDALVEALEKAQQTEKTLESRNRRLDGIITATEKRIAELERQNSVLADGVIRAEQWLLESRTEKLPDDVLDALQKVARIRLDLNDFDGDRRGIADCLCDAEEALIEVVNRRAAMLNGGKP